MPEGFPHLFLRAPTEVLGFTSVQQGGSKIDLPIRIPAEHARRLAIRLDQAWAAAETRQAAVHSTRKGCYIEFVSAPDFELALKSLEYRKGGIRLLNVRKKVDGSKKRTLATVFVPYEKRTHFLQKIRDYGSKLTGKKKPKNQRLVAPIDDIAAAVLQDFWTGRAGAIPGLEPRWVEIWLRTEDGAEIESFRSLLDQRGIKEHPDRPRLIFPERSVLLVFATGSQLADLIEQSDLIAEFREASEVPTFFLDLQNRDQAAWCKELLERLRIGENGNVAICILDQGVNRGHPLLGPILAEEDLHAYDPAWGTADHGGHGTLMAGIAGIGDLQAALEARTPIVVGHRLESAKILPPPPASNPKHLWGHVTAQGISRAEIQAPTRKRIICLAVTSQETRNRGCPTSWSAEVDALAAGVNNDIRRLIVVSAGNVTENWGNYPFENLTNEVHDPAQAWNALSVGACTFKTRITTQDYSGYTAVAPSGGLSPYSTTSLLWDHERWPIKPEVVVEGGNLAKNTDNVLCDPEDLRLLSTNRDITRAHFWPFEATSAASAQAGWMAAKIQSAYPNIWPETVRALLVHSASWTPAMIEQFLDHAGKGGYRKLLRTCGYGVPALGKALYCLRNTLTLISEQSIRPFVVRDGKPATNHMHLYELPWPSQELLALGETQVTMRVTLSYFIEPGPGEVGWSHRYRYPSHGLRFELNSPSESSAEFVKRINKQAREDEEEIPNTEAPNSFWLLGSQRNVGSIHSDIWRGRAADLAGSNLIAIRPVVGWWRERNHLGKVEKVTRYSLIVSIETPSQEIDIYTPVSTMIGVRNPVPVEISII